MNVSGVLKQVSQVWYKAFTSSNKYSAEGSNRLCMKCSREYIVTELEQASQGYQNKSITNTCLNYLSQAERHKLTEAYTSARAEQGAYTSKSKANLASFQHFLEFLQQHIYNKQDLMLVPGVIS